MPSAWAMVASSLGTCAWGRALGDSVICGIVGRETMSVNPPIVILSPLYTQFLTQCPVHSRL